MHEHKPKEYIDPEDENKTVIICVTCFEHLIPETVPKEAR